MPYIKDSDRRRIEDIYNLHNLGASCNTAGELNYTFTRILKGYLSAKGKRYQNINDIIGALESAKLELYRRTVAPYEDIKIVENGDV